MLACERKDQRETFHGMQLREQELGYYGIKKKKKITYFKTNLFCYTFHPGRLHRIAQRFVPRLWVLICASLNLYLQKIPYSKNPNVSVTLKDYRLSHKHWTQGSTDECVTGKFLLLAKPKTQQQGKQDITSFTALPWGQLCPESAEWAALLFKFFSTHTVVHL